VGKDGTGHRAAVTAEIETRGSDSLVGSEASSARRVRLRFLGRVLINRQPIADLDVPPNVRKGLVSVSSCLIQLPLSCAEHASRRSASAA
jgi:hypothetical protein